jgi:hypothetical protein
MSRKSWLALSVGTVATVAVLAASPTPAPAAGRAYKVVEVSGGATIKGIVRISEVPTLPKVSVFKDNEKGCGDKEQASERVQVGDDRGLGNTLVHLKAIESGKDWPEPMRSEDRTGVIDQKGCRYIPHVQWVRSETQLVILNSDAADHNIHGYRGSMADTQFNVSSAPGSKQDDVGAAFLEQPANYIVKCDIHPWMSAYVHAVDHPYHDVTSATAQGDRKPGEFRLENVPPGDYVVVAWHEGMVETPVLSDGKIAAYSYSPDVTVEKPLKVEAGKTYELDFVLEAPKK